MMMPSNVLIISDRKLLKKLHVASELRHPAVKTIDNRTRQLCIKIALRQCHDVVVVGQLRVAAV